MQIQTEMKIATAEVGRKSDPVKRPEPAALTRQSTVAKKEDGMTSYEVKTGIIKVRFTTVSGKSCNIARSHRGRVQPDATKWHR
jgi:hypothetical protein